MVLVFVMGKLLLVFFQVVRTYVSGNKCPFQLWKILDKKCGQLFRAQGIGILILLSKKE